VSSEQGREVGAQVAVGKAVGEQAEDEDRSEQCSVEDEADLVGRPGRKELIYAESDESDDTEELADEYVGRDTVRAKTPRSMSTSGKMSRSQSP
jgi:hypothetical protein